MSDTETTVETTPEVTTEVTPEVAPKRSRKVALALTEEDPPLEQILAQETDPELGVLTEISPGIKMWIKG